MTAQLAATRRQIVCLARSAPGAALRRGGNTSILAATRAPKQLPCLPPDKGCSSWSWSPSLEATRRWSYDTAVGNYKTFLPSAVFLYPSFYIPGGGFFLRRRGEEKESFFLFFNFE